MSERRQWSAAETKVLREMWANGRSGGAIALALGRSRSAVMGKINGLGLFGTVRDASAATAPVPKGSVSGSASRGKRWTEEVLTEKWADRKKRKP